MLNKYNIAYLYNIRPCVCVALMRRSSVNMIGNTVMGKRINLRSRGILHFGIYSTFLVIAHRHIHDVSNLEGA